MIRTSLEVYVESFGIIGALNQLNARIREEKNYHKREFFNTCRDILTTDRGGRVFDAAQRYHAVK